MSKLQELIRELCPNGVEYKKLGEVCDFINGFAFKSSLFHENGDRIIRITNIDGTNVNIDDVKYFWKSEYKNDLQQFMVQKGDILIAMSGATTGKIGYYSYDENSYLNQRVGKFVPIKEKKPIIPIKVKTIPEKYIAIIFIIEFFLFIIKTPNIF